MTTALPLMVFSDLDGTLIDHHTYDWTPAGPALNALKEVGAGVVLASSKTAVEVDALRSEMGLSGWPAIVENGAGLLGAHAAPDSMVDQYARLLAALDALPDALRSSFVGFDDMSAAELSAATGLSAKGADQAKQRAFSEPGTWYGSQEEKEAFLSQLKEQGIVAQQGGRFLTLSFGGTKAERVSALKMEYEPKITIALGDAPNDIGMLEACDYGVVIANPARAPLPPLNGEDSGRIHRTTGAGPAAWNEAVLDFLARHNLT
ncbi:MAG: HAD-IIB family hydrolase [Tateyamaria sp.]|uniref:HAD-IIB family hydrolase n=1 Tax=Tateyamaria sp. TaxID=1929288 RepID=UPI0032DD4367